MVFLVIVCFHLTEKSARTFCQTSQSKKTKIIIHIYLVRGLKADNFREEYERNIDCITLCVWHARPSKLKLTQMLVNTATWEWTFYFVKCVKVHHWKLWLSWNGYCFRSSENSIMITVSYLSISISLSRAQWCVLWPFYSCTRGVWWKRPPSSAIHKLWFSVSYRLYLWMKLCQCCLQWSGRRITSLWGRNLQSEGNYLRAADASKCELKLALAGGKNWVTRQLAANFIRNRYITWFKSNCRIQINPSSPFRK